MSEKKKVTISPVALLTIGDLARKLNADIKERIVSENDLIIDCRVARNGKYAPGSVEFRCVEVETDQSYTLTLEPNAIGNFLN